jgi:nitrite reductase/ring-hydroxylating ferredoxin subunit
MSVPPQSSGKDRATKHALLNAGALGVFAASWWMNRGSRHRPGPVVLQGLGSAMLSAAGWLGGTLVFRNQIAVDHRYANAGTWREETRPELAENAALVVSTDGLAVDQMKLVHARDARVVVARTEQGLAAFADRCTHKGGPLSDGVLMCGTVQCPWHGSQFDVTSGKVVCGPAKENIATYRVD